MRYLYLLRHAKAEENSPDGTDSGRRLLPKGYARLEEKIPAFKNKMNNLDLILTSPVLRARQTADFVAEALGKSDVLREERFLHAQNSADHILMELLQYHASDSILVVGHNPWISQLVHLFLEQPLTADLHLKTAALAHIVFEDDFGVGTGHLVEII